MRRTRRRRTARGKRHKLKVESYLFLFGLFVLPFVFLVNFFKSKPVTATFLTLILLGILIWFGSRAQRKKRLFRSALLSLGVQNHQQLSPLQYEQFCAFLLENSGWSVSLTKASGDQGADIIAHRKGQKMVVQCKRWNSSVGTKAVQEAYSAMAYYRAHRACVIGSSGYTRGARDLSKKTGVMLLHHMNTDTL